MTRWINVKTTLIQLRRRVSAGRLQIVASELKDPICHSDECQIGSFSSEATKCSQKKTEHIAKNVTVWNHEYHIVSTEHSARQSNHYRPINR